MLGFHVAWQVKEASSMACVVLAGCHSLIEVDNKLLGDPIEVAALRRSGFSPFSVLSGGFSKPFRLLTYNLIDLNRFLIGLMVFFGSVALFSTV